MQKALMSSKTEHWCTPESFLALVRQVGPIGLDPCSNPHSTVGAATSFCHPKDDGLILPWAGLGNQYVNPPYGRKLTSWSSKIVTEAAIQLPSEHLIVLTPARTDTKWCQQLLEAADARLFWKGRIKFIDPECPDKDQSAPFPSLVTYFGNDLMRFSNVFGPKGFLC
jgi:hypothetical protein